MALRTTALTPVPLNLDGTFQQPTWGEDNAPYTTPPELATGFGAQVLAAETLNYNFQQPTAVTRSLMDRSVLSSEGLFTTCVVSQGAWNTLGGTLNITLTPTRIVIDVSQTGGAVLELFATLGDPEVLPALSDSYVDIKDGGTVTVVSVANAAPEPALTADSVRTYLLVTDAAQLTSAALVPAVAPFPCLGPTIGLATAFIDELTVTGAVSANTIAATTTVTAGTQVNTGTLVGTGLATVGGLQVDGGATIGEDNTDTMQVLATAVMPDIGASTLKGVLSVLGPGAGFLGEFAGDATSTINWLGSAFYSGRFNLAGTTSTAAGDLSIAGGHLRYNDGANTHYVLKSQGGGVHGFGEALAPAPALNVLIDTSAAVAPLIATDLKIVGTAWIQRNGAGDCTVSIEEVGGAGQLGTADPIAVPTDIGTDYKVITFTRVRAAADTTARIYRMKLTGGGNNITAINATITVTEAP